MSDILTSVDDTISSFIEKLAVATGYKYLKSRRALKKTVGSLVFEVLFYSSKWNDTENVGINAGFRVSYKKYGVVSTVDSIVASKSIDAGPEYWFDISTSDLYNETLNYFVEELNNIAVDLAKRFEKDIKEASYFLLNEKFYEYSVALDFLEDILGTDSIKYRVDEMVDALSDEEHQQIEDYKNGARNKTWMLNRGNLRYIVNNGYV